MAVSHDSLHFDIFRAACFHIPQQAEIPCIAAALAAAVAETQLATNRRAEGAAIRAATTDAARRERNRAATEREHADRADQLQARALRAGALVWIHPTPLYRRLLLVSQQLNRYRTPPDWHPGAPARIVDRVCLSQASTSAPPLRYLGASDP